jgi:eukaryotic-like serine/threonine-protein kinase
MIGKALGRYRILKKLGEGGMGQVYLANDERLQRNVALKVLPPGVLADETARKRFRRESLALSKLNHPNIETVYDFDTQDGIDFLVMEYVDGVTLRWMISTETLSEKEISRLAVQIAEGCVAAHEAGVIHCDLKPANIMVTSGGRIKILDFGLAKLAQPVLSTGSTNSSHTSQKAGGTLPYMAPEQLTGNSIDLRTDIYAFGNVMYEMATGRLPFQESISSALVADILARMPQPPGRLRPEVSSRLEEIILKCLEKDPENRYQSVKEILVDLRRSSSSPMAILPQAGKPDTRLRRMRIAVAVAAIAVILVASWFIWHLGTDKSTLPEYRVLLLTRTEAAERQPTISPEGKQIAYSSNASGNSDIYLVDVRGGNPIRLTTDLAADTEPSWFPDSGAIAFTSDREGAKSVWKVDPRSGGVTLLVPDAEEPAISPDGKSIVFCRTSGSGYLRIWIAPLGAPSNAKMITGDSDGIFDHFSPTWSPDGNRICYGSFQGLWIAPVSGGPAQRLTHDGYATEPRWSSSGRFIYFSSYLGGVRAVWRVPADGGLLQRVTTGTGLEGHPDVSRDGKLLCYSSGDVKHQAFILNRIARTTIMVPALGALESEIMASVAPDGSKIVFPSDRWGQGSALWVMPLSNGPSSAAPYQLTERPGIASHPVFSPDGRWLAYYQIQHEVRKIITIPAHGGQPNQLTDGPAQDTDPAWYPDGSRIAFVSDEKGKARIGIVRVEQGRGVAAPRWLNMENIVPSWLSWSPDGKAIAFLGSKNRQSELWKLPADGSAPAQQLTHGADGRCIKWDRSSGLILMSAGFGRHNILLYQVSPETGDSQPFQPAVQFGGADAYGMFDISGDGRILAFFRTVNQTGQIWTLEALNGFF